MLQNPGDGSWYYGSAYRGIIEDGYPLETNEDRKKYGRVYTHTNCCRFCSRRMEITNIATKCMI